jgi:hypothetical protein
VIEVAKLRELGEEFRTVFTGRGNLADSIVPPAIFVIVNAVLGFEAATWGSLAVAVAITVLRLAKRQPLRYAMGGVGAVVVAILASRLLGRAEGYFLPGIITGGLTVVTAVTSVIAGRPLVAWTSYVYRRWPLDWYWHAKVRPAYSEVTWLWALFFAMRLLFQFSLFQDKAAGLLAAVNLVTGWPATILLLVISYVYGTWRLRHLGGPSVEEFRAGAEPPWAGQRRGF